MAYSTPPVASNEAGTHAVRTEGSRSDASAARRSFDWTVPFSVTAVLLLAALVLLPLFWLLVTSLQDDAKNFTLASWRQLVVDPAFVRPLWF